MPEVKTGVEQVSKLEEVYILGAGFTKSFDSGAPMGLCNIDLSSLLKTYHNRSKVEEILEDTVATEANKVNIELLLTRLQGMPYDESDSLWDSERKTVYENTLNQFNELLKSIKFPKNDDATTLRKFASHIISSKSSCITFNYDNLLDIALLETEHTSGKEMVNSYIPSTAWNPQKGYGFRFLPARTLINDYIIPYDNCDTLLLKLHGSMGWFVKKGYEPPYRLDALVQNIYHQQKSAENDEIKYHIESVPFIIPPLLDKTILYKYPILRIIWYRAFEKLVRAKKVFFIGYSFPETDIVSRYFFKESLRRIDQSNITVISIDKSYIDKENFKQRYNNALGKDLQNFVFMNAKDWISNNL